MAENMLLSAVTDTYLSNSEPLSNISDVIFILKEDYVFSKKNTNELKKIISHINTSLKSVQNRGGALILLSELLNQCSTQVFEDNAITWLKLIIEILQSPNSAKTYQLSCGIISSILRNSSSFSEISREIANQHISPIIHGLLEVKEKCMTDALKCLTIIFETYKGPSGHYKGKLEKLLINLLDSTDDGTLQASADCFAMLASSGPGGNLGVKYIEAWTTYCQKTAGSLHDILDELYGSLGLDSDSKGRPDVNFTLFDVSCGQSNRTFQLQRRFSALCLYLNKLLSVDIGILKKVPMLGLLQLVCRTTSISPKLLLSVPTQERLTLRAVLPFLQSNALTILQGLILSCRSSLAPYTQVINKLFLQLLLWSHSSQEDYGEGRPFRSLRCMIYETLHTYLLVLGAASRMDLISEDLIKQLLLDCSVQNNSMKMGVSPAIDSAAKSGSSRKRKKGGAGQGYATAPELSSQRKLDFTANRAVCSIALQVLNIFLMKIGPLLKPTQQRDIQDFTVRALISCQKCLDLKQLIPYSDRECRLQLYRLLQTCVVCPHPQYPPPTHCAVNLLQAGCLDVDIKVMEFCTESLATCTAILHPRVQPRHLPSYIDIAAHSSGLDSRDQEADEPTLPSTPLSVKSTPRLTIVNQSRISIEAFSTKDVFEPMSEEICREREQRKDEPVASTSCDVDRDLSKLRGVKSNGDHAGIITINNSGENESKVVGEHLNKANSNLEASCAGDGQDNSHDANDKDVSHDNNDKVIMKRKYEGGESIIPAKKSGIEVDVSEMLHDFVDAGPDSD